MFSPGKNSVESASGELEIGPKADVAYKRHRTQNTRAMSTNRLLLEHKPRTLKKYKQTVERASSFLVNMEAFKQNDATLGASKEWFNNQA